MVAAGKKLSTNKLHVRKSIPLVLPLSYILQCQVTYHPSSNECIKIYVFGIYLPVVTSDPLWCLWLQLRNQMSLVYKATSTWNSEDSYLSATWLSAIKREIKLCEQQGHYKSDTRHATLQSSLFTQVWEVEFLESQCKLLRSFVDRY